ncbi:hypothetical protein V6N12_050187 [Hibiscus sabdariffa]|uniref:Uncharacterized protein n=1 Tax=Hibiscus sabdariffa TaxID=183260 RepID=A0ABR2GCW0_9ROSI
MTLAPANPNDAHDGRPSPYESPGGRPLEGVTTVTIPILLERPGSPVAIEDQRIPKKGCNSTDGTNADLRVMAPI